MRNVIHGNAALCDDPLLSKKRKQYEYGIIERKKLGSRCSTDTTLESSEEEETDSQDSKLSLYIDVRSDSPPPMLPEAKEDYTPERGMDWKQFLHRKLLLSWVIWLIAYAIMGIFGGSVAFYHFPRVSSVFSEPRPLPDFGYDLIPYWCPLWNDGNTNLQSTILLFFYCLIFIGALYKPNGQGRRILQQLLHLNAIVFLARTTTVGVTGLPQPNPRCTSVQSTPVSYSNALHFVLLRSFPPHACGDLVFSGHVACILMSMVIFLRHSYFDSLIAWTLLWCMAFLAIFAVISCRSHYTIDVVLAVYFVYFIQDWYYCRLIIPNPARSSQNSNMTRNQNKNIAAYVIQWMEDIIQDCHDDDCLEDKIDTDDSDDECQQQH